MEQEFEKIMGIASGFFNSLLVGLIGAVLVSAGENFGYVMLILAGIIFALGLGAVYQESKSKEGDNGDK